MYPCLGFLHVQIIAFEQRQIEREDRRFAELQKMACHCLRDKPATTAEAHATGEPERAAGPMQTAHQPLPTPAKQRGSTDLLVLGDSITKSLGKQGLESLTKKRTVVSSTGGAVPATLPLHDDTPTATDIVIHVGTNSVNNSNEHEIADSILQSVTSIRGVNPDGE